MQEHLPTCFAGADAPQQGGPLQTAAHSLVSSKRQSVTTDADSKKSTGRKHCRSAPRTASWEQHLTISAPIRCSSLVKLALMASTFWASSS